MSVCLIAAVSKNGVIGNEFNEMPWAPLIEDLKNFREATTGNIIVMGARTYESIGSKPLPNRENVVFTRRIKEEYDTKGVKFFSNEVDFLNAYNLEYDDIYIIGGSHLFKMFINIADTMLLTEIDKEYVGNIKFPDIENKEWDRAVIGKGTQEDVSYNFVEYNRKVL